MPEPLTGDQHTRLREIAGCDLMELWDQDDIDALRESLPALLDENDRLRRENDDLHDDVLRAITERNEVARIAAAELHPGPDAADDEIRRELIQEWLDEGRDDAEGWHEKFQQAVLRLSQIENQARQESGRG